MCFPHSTTCVSNCQTDRHGHRGQRWVVWDIGRLFIYCIYTLCNNHLPSIIPRLFFFFFFYWNTVFQHVVLLNTTSCDDDHVLEAVQDKFFPYRTKHNIVINRILLITIWTIIPIYTPRDMYYHTISLLSTVFITHYHHLLLFFTSVCHTLSDTVNTQVIHLPQ